MVGVICIKKYMRKEYDIKSLSPRKNIYLDKNIKQQVVREHVENQRCIKCQK